MQRVKPSGSLKPWREVIMPHQDIASGRFQQAEFAADLWQVYLGDGVDEYRLPSEFFRRTFLTDGLKHLLKGALLRLTSNGGDPVIELQTNFGGGKTHSMLALFHLFSGTSATELPGIEQLLTEAGVPQPPKVNRVVIVGNKISPGQPLQKSDGTAVRTLWGEIAWQLGGREGYQMIEEADRSSTNPGDKLRELFNRYSPCLILIDEWVAYARQLHDQSDLPGGSFETQFTFAQTLSEAAKASKNTLLVVSIPASESQSDHLRLREISDIEVGGERGRVALERLKNAIGRVESPWRLASTEEGLEIVRRRLFQPIIDKENFVARDTVARAFSELYRAQAQEFPPECKEADYERRLKAAYPIHPELFDRLYNDWSSLDKFQRTRGVLRLMATVIHSLWQQDDRSLLILPASVPIDQVQFELTRYLDDQWLPVIEKDVDGPNALPLQLDRQNPTLSRYSACRRVARTIYLGSAPTLRAAKRSLGDRQIKLGCVQPGESVATFGDALRRLTDKATFLYVDGMRYWYSTQATVTRLAEDRASQFSIDDVHEEIKKRLREIPKRRENFGDFAKVQSSPTSSGEVPDEHGARLVIVGPEYPHASKERSSPARGFTAEILATRGVRPRIYQNTLLFLAPDRARLTELEQGVRQFLAWSSIKAETEILNLDTFQKNQAITKCSSADAIIENRIPETYCWLLCPTQSTPTSEVEWEDSRLQGQEALAIRASKKLRNEEGLVVQLAATRLKLELDRIPLWRSDNVSIKQLTDDFAQYLYLPRLKKTEVLIEAIKEGVALLSWQTESYAYADGWDATKERYCGLKTGQYCNILINNDSLLVKSAAATKQCEAELAQQSEAEVTRVTTTPPVSIDNVVVENIFSTTQTQVTPGKVIRQPTRFHGSVKIDPTRVDRDAGRISEEVIQHLTQLIGANAEISLEIHVEIPEGVPDNVVRTVTENCQTLRFDRHGFKD